MAPPVNTERSQHQGPIAHPAVSVIVPCWNAEQTIEATLASLRDQTFADFEVILVDDGSTDGTLSALDRWAAADARFRVFQVANGGPSRARNHAALMLARGDILAFLDADDLWVSTKLELVVEALRADPGLCGVYGRTAFFRDNPMAARTVSQVLDHPVRPADLLRGNPTCTMSNVVVRTEAFRSTGGFDPSIVHCEDIEWLVRLTAGGGRFEAIDETLVFYRSSDAGLSLNLDSMHAGWRHAAASAERAGFGLTPSALRAAEAVHLRLLARRALRGQAPRFSALGLAVRGALRSPVGFFGDPVRGLLTLLAACAQPLLPANVRRLALQF